MTDFDRFWNWLCRNDTMLAVIIVSLTMFWIVAKLAEMGGS